MSKAFTKETEVEEVERRVHAPRVARGQRRMHESLHMINDLLTLAAAQRPASTACSPSCRWQRACPLLRE